LQIPRGYDKQYDVYIILQYQKVNPIYALIAAAVGKGHDPLQSP
jgi:hypothetical protein